MASGADEFVTKPSSTGQHPVWKHALRRRGPDPCAGSTDVSGCQLTVVPAAPRPVSCQQSKSQVLLATAAWLATAWQNEHIRVGLFGESRLCLFSLSELLLSRSQCPLRLFPVQLLCPNSQNCCAARKA